MAARQQIFYNIFRDVFSFEISMKLADHEQKTCREVHTMIQKEVDAETWIARQSMRVLDEERIRYAMG